MNAAIFVSSLSAATSDIYISSRFLFFLARCGHAPSFFGLLVKYPSDDTRMGQNETNGSGRVSSLGSASVDPNEEVPEDADLIRRTSDPSDNRNVDHSSHDSDSEGSEDPFPRTQSRRSVRKRKPCLVIPLLAVLASASLSSLCFLGIHGPDRRQLVSK